MPRLLAPGQAVRVPLENREEWPHLTGVQAASNLLRALGNNSAELIACEQVGELQLEHKGKEHWKRGWFDRCLLTPQREREPLHLPPGKWFGASDCVFGI